MVAGETLIRFRAFFRGVHGVDPYPWQEKLLERVVDRGWPSAIALPTGSGKTAALDVALFHMALSPEAPRRVVYVVNRRLVVDQVEDRALQILKALTDPRGEEGVHWVAERLLALAGKGGPLMVAKLRGGLLIPRHPVEDPANPAVLLSTVDQVGSRLLFRGYALSPQAWPVEAGLLAVDTLFLLDEAHLEQPFFNLLRSLEKEVAPAATLLGRPTLRVVALTATPETLGDLEAFTPTPDDRAHPYLGRLWTLPKPLALRKVPKGELAKVLVAEARALLEAGKGPVVVFCNRVDRARDVFTHLEKDFPNRTVLLTGRIRPFDRDQLLGEGGSRGLQTRLDRGEVAVVVATQTLEVGADLSFNGLVTELCPLTALFQRLGRLGRRGEDQVQGVAVWAEEEAPYPYGKEELRAAWDWLAGVARDDKVDAGIEGLARAKEQLGPVTWGRTARSALYTPDLLRLFALTDPSVPGLDPEPFLHGLEERSPEVGLAFRSDLTPELLEREDLTDLARIIPPPNPYEVLEVPLWAARAFLGGVLAEEVGPEAVSDLEAEAQPPAGRRPRKGPRHALRYAEDRGEIRLERVDPGGIRPGDLLLLPAMYGGLDRFGWNPVDRKSEPVRDVAEARPLGERPPWFFRLHPQVLWDMLREEERHALVARLQGPEEASADVFWSLGEQLFRDLAGYFQAVEDEDPDRLARAGAALDQNCARLGVPTPHEVLEENLEAARERGLVYLNNLLRWLVDRVEPPWRPAVETALAKLSRARVEQHPAYPGLVLRIRPEVLSLAGEEPVALNTHQEAVLKALEDFAKRLGLPPQLKTYLESSARWHDEGKRDPRMQAWLLLTAPAGEALPPPPLAKSGTRLGWREVLRLRRTAGYPPGQRHEFQAAAAFRGRTDPLVVHLIATHHGYGRPFPKPPQEQDPDLEFLLWDKTLARVDHGLDRFGSGWVVDFFTLQEQYTPWGLAYLEALLRLADQRASVE